MNRIDVIETKQEIVVDFGAGEVVEVEQHDGSVLRLRKLKSDYDATNRISAMNYVQEHHAKGEVVTGLLYVDSEAGDMHEHINTTETAFNKLTSKQLCPGASVLEKFNASLR